MNRFKREFDKSKALGIIRKTLIGLGSPNFDDGTGLEKKSGLTDITFKSNDPLKNFKGSIDAETLEDLEKIVLKFTYDGNKYTAELKMGEFRVRKIWSGKIADCYETVDFDLQYKLTGNKEADKQAIEALIKKGLEINVNELNAEEASDYEYPVMGVTHDGSFCHEPYLAYLLFEFLSKQLGFIRASESAYLKDVFMINNAPVRVEELEQVMSLEFEQTFKILKENDHTKENKIVSNDLDDHLFYVEKDDIQGCVYRSQSNLFLMAKNSKTGVIKVWNTIDIPEDWFSWIDSGYVVNKNGKVFDVAVYLQDFVNNRNGNSYDYPFEFNATGYRSSVEHLMENFETHESELIYDSERGFMQSKSIYFNSLLMQINCSIDLLTDEYQIEKDLLVLTKQDINSPDYFMRSMQDFSKTFSTNRASMLFYLFLCGGNGIVWNGKTFTTGNTLNRDYSATEGMKDYGPLGYTNKIRVWGFPSEKLFNLPENMSIEWKQVVFEFSFYMKEWIEESENNKNKEFEYGADAAVKEAIENAYNKYYDKNTYEKIISNRK